MSEPGKSTQDTRWRQLPLSAQIDVAMLIGALATLVLPVHASDVLAALIAWFGVRIELPWEWT